MEPEGAEDQTRVWIEIKCLGMLGACLVGGKEFDNLQVNLCPLN